MLIPLNRSSVGPEFRPARFPIADKQANLPEVPQFASAVSDAPARTRISSGLPAGLMKIQSGAVRFGSNLVIPGAHDLAFVKALQKVPPQFTNLLVDAKKVQEASRTPELTLHHMAVAALDQAIEEINKDFGDYFPNRLDKQGVDGREIDVLNFDESRPPIINGLIEDRLYRKEEGRNVSITLFKSDGMGNRIPARMLPAKVFYGEGDLKQKQIIQLLEGFKKRILREVTHGLRTAPASEQTSEAEFLKQFVVQLHTKRKGQLYSADLLQGIGALTDAQLKTAPKFVKSLSTLLKDMTEEAEVIANQSTSDTGQLVNRLDDLSVNGHMPKKVRFAIRQEIERLTRKDSRDPEGDMIRTWVDRSLALPWHKTPPVNIDLKLAKDIMDRDHYGMDEVKQRIIDYLATMKQNPGARPKILCFVGPPGTGKTSISKDIAEALGRNFERISVDGVTDEHEIKGHRKTYIGAAPGLITESVKKAGSLNPVILIDEVDKLGGSGDPKAQAAKSALLSVLDPEQNKEFQDLYYGFPFPLNDVFFILTANYMEQIPPALRDRVEIIELERYDDKAKYEIATKHLIPQVLKNQGLSDKNIEITPGAIKKTIEQYTREAGVRNLKRKLSRLAEVVTTQRQTSPSPDKFPKVTVDELKLETEAFLGTPVFEKPERISGDVTGEINGLAYTEYGGNTLVVQVNATPASEWKPGNITGNLQDVMRESARYSIGYLKAHHSSLALKAPFDTANSGVEVDIHFPAAAVPKDGPSAGAAITTAIVSELTGITVRPEVAMTGEIDIKGQILPIGGLKEKVDAAYRAGITEIYIPMKNQKDLAKIPKEQLDAVKIIPVKHINEILEKALVRSPFKATPA